MPNGEHSKSSGKTSGDSDKESKNLSDLLKLIQNPSSKQQLPSLKYGVGRRNLSQTSGDKTLSSKNQTSEAQELAKFREKYKDVRNFSSHQHGKCFQDICISLTKHRLSSRDWLKTANVENILSVLKCLRILLRDSTFQKKAFNSDTILSLAEYFERITEEYVYSTEGPYSMEILKEITNIFQKFSATVDHCELLVNHKVHISLIRLLVAKEVFVLHCSLYALIGLAQSKSAKQCIAESIDVEKLLSIIGSYDNDSKRLAANLLRLLCSEVKAREQVRKYDGVSTLLRQLDKSGVSLLWHVVWCIVFLCEDLTCKKQMRELGGIPLMLSLLHDRKFVKEQHESSSGALASAGAHRKPLVDEQDDFIKLEYSLKEACCSALTELVMDDTNAQQIVQANGIYSLGLLILPQEYPTDRERKCATNLQLSAFRALRFLFSMERNRRLFKHLFPPELYEMFIDVGHYVRDLDSYKLLASKINSLPRENVNEIMEKICDTNQNKEPRSHIGDFDVFELLGTGAFGSVYKVRKKSGQTFRALKEVNVQNTAFGKNAKEKQQSIGEITNELKIIEKEMKHPNIVRYFKTFELNDKLYILMELIEGANLGEHFNSLKEKQQRFEEQRIWNILIQLLLALRYLHKEKGIVHRDLTPNNIIIGENDKVTITDFGLAKQKSVECSKMNSVVGTILYSCPEVIQNVPYSEKADIWSLGCILYQMCMLLPPFSDLNILILAKKIVAVEYIPIPKTDYTERLINIITRCLNANVDQRPDVIELSSIMADRLLGHMDQLRIANLAIKGKLDRERKRTHRHFLGHTSENYQDEGQSSLDGSDGAERLKVVNMNQVTDEDGTDSTGGQSVAVSVSSIQFDGNIYSDDESFSGSGSESRGSSAGSIRPMRRGPILPIPPIRKVTQRDSNMNSIELNIPGSVKGQSDSFSSSSGNQSPNSQLSPSMPPLKTVSNMTNTRFGRSVSTNEASRISQNSRMEKRSKSSAMLKISPSHLQEKEDPIMKMMEQLHKIIYLTQLPPTVSPNPNRRIIEQYKKALFGKHSSPDNLKTEIIKLLRGSQDMIDLDFGFVESFKRFSGSDIDSPVTDMDRNGSSLYDPDFKDVGITYEYLQSILETSLEERGYYNQIARPKQ